MPWFPVPRAPGTGAGNCVTAVRQARCMSRRRDLESSEWFHIVHKGADDQDIFSAPSHRTVYEGFMADAFERSAIEVHAYAWMTNHLHKFVRVPHGGLPEAMRLLGMRYATVYNGWTDRSGPLFTARYFSEPVTSDAQLAQTARYIHRNPLPIVGTAGLVEYRWSSLGALCGRGRAPVAEQRSRDGRLRHRRLRAVCPGAPTERSDRARGATASDADRVR